MKALIYMVMFFAVAMVGLKVATAVAEDHAKASSSAKMAENAEKHDKEMKDACAKGHTGVVLYYKGVHCGK